MAGKVTAGRWPLSVELKGRRELSRTLRQAGEDLEVLKVANAEAAAIVEYNAVGLVPVESGDLARSIRSTGTKSAGVVRAGSRSLPYAGPIHWGWPKRNIKANTFIADAAKQTEDQWAQIYQTAVEKALARIKGI